jgi:hypothetical protein
MTVELTQTVERLLVAVSARTSALASARSAYAERLAPDYNVFDFISGRELQLSKVLAWLLDPKGNHAQGSRFLEAFVAAFVGWDDFDAANASVQVEAACGERRRIDILITSGRDAIAIENKPSAADQPGQLDHYLRYLDRFERRCLVYLTGTAEREPSLHSIAEHARIERVGKKELVTATYADLSPWLEISKGRCRAERVRGFIDDLQTYVLTRFGGFTDMTEKDALVELITRDSASVTAAFQVAAAWKVAADTLLERLHDQLVDHAPAGWAVEGELNHQRYSQILLFKREQPDVRFCLQFDNSGLRDCVYGVVLAPPNKAKSQVVADRLANSAFGPAPEDKPTAQWPWWRYATPDDAYFPAAYAWMQDAEVWREIQSGSLARRMWVLAPRLVEAAT